MDKEHESLEKFLCFKVNTTGLAALKRHCSLGLIVSTWLATPVHAQQANQPGFDPRQTEKRFEHQDARQGSRGDHPRLPSVRPTRAEENATAPMMLLRQVSIEGATAIPQSRLASAYEPYLGRRVSHADLAQIVNAISESYRVAGFHLSRAIIPPQDAANGELRIKVIEGAITELVLKGDEAKQFGVRTMMEPVIAERPARLATLERQLYLTTARPGISIKDTAIEEIGSASGQFRLVLSIRTWHVFASVGVDNFGSSSVGPWQSYGTVAYNSALTPGDSVAVNLSTTPGDPRQLAFGRVAYELPVGIDGFRVGASGYYSEVRPGDFRRLDNDHVKTNSFEMHGIIAPLQSQKATVTLTAATTFTNSSEADVYGLWYADKIRTASFTFDGRLQDDLRGTNYLTVNFRQGLDILGASQRGGEFLSREGASGQFAAMTFWFTRYQTLSDAWSLKVAAAGQTASGPLFTSQQFYLGGLAFGRGYGSAEISGDNGLAGTAELRFDQQTSLQHLNGYQIYGFIDSGVAWNSGYQLHDGLSLTSVGGGIRLFLKDGVQADLGVAVPLTYRSYDNDTRDARVLFSLSSAVRLCPVRSATRCL